jgi:hypothetical protein
MFWRLGVVEGRVKGTYSLAGVRAASDAGLPSVSSRFLVVYVALTP